MTFAGFELDDIDSIAQPLLQALDDTGETDVRLKVLALCRAITLIGSESDLDNACQMIDEMSDFIVTEALGDQALSAEWEHFGEDDDEDDLPLDHISTLELDEDEGDDDADVD